ncbi:MAG: sugar transferase [Treponema sp.]
MTKNTIKLRQFSVFCVDLSLLFSSIYITLFIRYHRFPRLDIFFNHVLHFIPIIATWLILMYTMKMYNLNKMLMKRTGLLEMLSSAFISMLVGFSVFYLFFSSITPRGFLVLYSFLSFTLLVFWRFYYTLVSTRKKELLSILFIGYDSVLEDIIPYLSKDNYFKYKIVGIFENNPVIKENLISNTKMLKDRQALLGVLENSSPDIIILADDRAIDSSIKADLFALMGTHHQFILLHEFYEIILRKVPVGQIHDTWILSNIDLSSRQYFFFMKRLFDIGFSLFILCLMLIPFLIIAIAIKFDSKGGILFKQIREGKGGRHFSIIKFRSMHIDGNTFAPTEKKDARITRVGSFLRKTRLDEFPQFINVLMGDMSIIGPRPERPELAITLEKEVPFYKQRLLVKPGITGWDQVSGEYHSPSIADTCKKMQHDLYYIKNCSVLLDLSILFKTIATVLVRSGV